jgi:hypothetical protein
VPRGFHLRGASCAQRFCLRTEPTSAWVIPEVASTYPSWRSNLLDMKAKRLTIDYQPSNLDVVGDSGPVSL